MFAGREKRKFGRPVTRCKNALILDVSAPRGRNWRVANLSIATDESYFDKSGQKVDKTEWHRAVTFQDKLIDRLLKQAKKGRLISLEGRMQTRRWRKAGEDSDRFSTEILVVPGDRVQFYDKPNGAAMQADPAIAGHNGGPSLDDAPASLPAGLDDDIPF